MIKGKQTTNHFYFLSLSFLTDNQENEIPDKDKLQANKTDNKTISRISSLLSLDEETLAERAFDEYMMIMNSLFPEVHDFL